MVWEMHWSRVSAHWWNPDGWPTQMVSIDFCKWLECHLLYLLIRVVLLSKSFVALLTNTRTGFANICCKMVLQKLCFDHLEKYRTFYKRKCCQIDFDQNCGLFRGAQNYLHYYQPRWNQYLLSLCFCDVNDCGHQYVTEWVVMVMVLWWWWL